MTEKNTPLGNPSELLPNPARTETGIQVPGRSFGNLLPQILNIPVFPRRILNLLLMVELIVPFSANVGCRRVCLSFFYLHRPPLVRNAGHDVSSQPQPPAILQYFKVE